MLSVDINSLEIANTRFSQFQSERDPANLDEAIVLYQTAIDLLFDDDCERAAYVNNLAIMLKTRCSYNLPSGNVTAASDLDDAILLCRESVVYTPDHDPNRSSRLHQLYMTLSMRFRLQNRADDLDEAIITIAETILLTPPDHPHESLRLNSGGVSHHKRFDLRGDLADLDKAIVHYSRSLQVVPPTNSEHHLDVLCNLALSLKTRFQHRQDIHDLNKSILYCRESVQLVAQGHPRQWPCMNNLALLLHMQYEQDGKKETMDECIGCFREAARLCSQTDRPSCYTNLAVSLCTRFERLDERKDLDESIALCQHALGLTPVGHDDRSYVINQLGLSLQRRYELKGDHDDGDRVISLRREAVELALAHDSDYPAYLNNLAMSLVDRYRRGGEETDFTEGISFYETSLELTPATHSAKPSRLNNMASALYFHCTTRSPNAPFLGQVISLFREAVQLTPSNHSERALYLNNLADSLTTRFTHRGDASDLNEALRLWSLAVKIPSTSPSTRFDISKHWAKTATLHNRPDSALVAYSTAISLLHRITSIGVDINSRKRRLELRAIDLPCDAARCAIELGRYEDAVELLESGRSIIWQQLLRLRTPLHDLRVVAPDIANELEKIGKELERGGFRQRVLSGSGFNSEVETDVDKIENHYSRLEERWEALVAQARTIPGFERFLLPIPFLALVKAAKNGPVVLLNATERGCDALILEATNLTIQQVVLPDVTLAKVRAIAKRMGALAGSGLRDSESGDPRHGRRVSSDPFNFPDILAQIWHGVVNPVLQKLCIKPASDPHDLPRIWWCPVGAFVFLPVHDAGVYAGADGRADLADYAVSSYIPSIGALLTECPPSDPLKVVVAISPHSPHLPPLPETQKELEQITKIVPSCSLSSLVGSNASAKKIFSELATATVAHFACHGEQHLTNPLDSALIIHEDRLKISGFMQEHMPNASLVFLNACFTATVTQELPDEVIHLASAMLFTGFRGAIATMWSIRDVDGPTVAEGVYRRLFQRSPFDVTAAARALHLAVSDLKGKGVDFIRWVPFIHLGL